jgi:surfeit locus 1 family protein
VATPQQAVSSASSGQRVEVEATLVASDVSVISGRINHGVTGYWVTAHAVTSAGASLAIAAGWTESEDDAARAADILSGDDAAASTLVGRYLPSEGSYDDDFEAGSRSAMAVATLVNEWTVAPETVYGGYLILEEPLAGLEHIDSPEPGSGVTLNWLNIFYAIEWIVFAGFALYLWYRLVRDAWEREVLEAEEAAASAANPAELN